MTDGSTLLALEVDEADEKIGESRVGVLEKKEWRFLKIALIGGALFVCTVVGALVFEWSSAATSPVPRSVTQLEEEPTNSVGQALVEKEPTGQAPTLEDLVEQSRATAAAIAEIREEVARRSKAGSAPAEHVFLPFNCSDNTLDIDELLACHKKKSERLGKEVLDMEAGCAGKLDAFLAFLLAHKRTYYHQDSVDVTEFKQRLEIFCGTLSAIETRNAQSKLSGLSNPAKHGVTKYADWSPEEFQSILGGRKGSRMESRRLPGRRLDTAQSGSQASCTSDWSSRGKVRNQGKCGNCWAFSTAEAIRSAMWQQTGQDPGVLSTQYLTDCYIIEQCKGRVNGCCGGIPEEAMIWLKEQGGIPTQEAYGDIYSSEQDAASNANTSSSGSSTGPVSEVVASLPGITYSGNAPNKSFPCKSGIPPAVQLEADPTVLYNETDMESFVCETGSMSIMVSTSGWNTYIGGVMDAKSCGTEVDHAVLLIGVNKGENAWLVQNSWGVDFGISTSGQAAPSHIYSNCAQLAGKNQSGCRKTWPWGVTVAEACSVYCGDSNTTSGGYIWLQFGANTCEITYEPVQVPTLKAAPS